MVWNKTGTYPTVLPWGLYLVVKVKASKASNWCIAIISIPPFLISPKTLNRLETNTQLDIAKTGYTAGTTHKPLRKKEPAIPAEYQQKSWDVLIAWFTNARQSAKSIAYESQWTFANHPTTLTFKNMSMQEQNQDTSSLVHSQNRRSRQCSSSAEDLLFNSSFPTTFCSVLCYYLLASWGYRNRQPIRTY